jgi:hypothetical protein
MMSLMVLRLTPSLYAIHTRSDDDDRKRVP